MRVIAIQYFKDSRQVWHQPGTVIDDISPDELAKLEQDGRVKITRTAMAAPTDTRGRGFRASEKRVSRQ